MKCKRPSFADIVVDEGALPTPTQNFGPKAMSLVLFEQGSCSTKGKVRQQVHASSIAAAVSLLVCT